MLFSDGPDKAFLVPDSCRVTEGNGNSINADLTDDTIYNYKIDDDFSYFRQFVSWFGLFHIAG